tara:strand:- start:1443 stop:1616 length:174 start_codon:yes stop_codon:yes gene_type:complete
MNSLIILLIVVTSILSIVFLIVSSGRGLEGTKGITKEYVTDSGIKRTARRDRADFIV